MTIHHTVNSGGVSVIVPASSQHVEYVEIAGTGTYRILVVDASARSKPGIIELALTFPPISGIDIQIFDTYGGGGTFTTEGGSPITDESGSGTFTTEGAASPIASFITDGIQLSGYLRASTENTARVTPMLRVCPAL